MWFGLCHCGIQVRHGRLFLEVSIQYWTLASIEVSHRQAAIIADTFLDVEDRLRRGRPSALSPAPEPRHP